MSARSSVTFPILSLLAIAILAVGIGWAKRSRADAADSPGKGARPDILYSELSPTPKPAPDPKIFEREDGTLTLEEAAANSQQSKQSVDEILAWANRDADKIAAAWGEYTKQMAVKASMRKAEYESGLAGIEMLGVR